jgi:hypothetical protein
MVFVSMHATVLHVGTIRLIQKILHQVHFVEYLIFQKLKKHNDYLDQPLKIKKKQKIILK